MVGDALGIGLFNQLRESGSLGCIASGSGTNLSFAGQRSRRNSLFAGGGPLGDVDTFLLPGPNAIQGRSQLGGGALAPLAVGAGWAKKTEDLPDTSLAREEGGVKEAGAGVVAGGASGSALTRLHRTRRSSIVGPPLSPGEIEQVVGSFEVDEKVTVSSSVAA